jgi:DNA-directed RNA polymerase subunit L
MSGPKITSIKIKDISPKLSGEAGKLLPKTLKPESCEFELHNVSLAIANGIRRAIISETKTRALTMLSDDFHTNDVFVKLPDFIISRIRCIPVKQSVSLNAVYKLSVTNNTADMMDVKTSHLTGGPSNMFDETITILKLNPGKYVTIDKITIDEGYGYNFAGYSTAYGATCIPLDVIPYNMYTGEGVKSMVSDPRSHKIAFDTNGTIDCHNLISNACHEIIDRLENIRTMMYKLQQLEDKYQLYINGENDTTGNIIMKTVCDLYKDIPMFIYTVDDINKGMRLDMQTDDPNGIINGAIKYASDVLKKIASSL